MQELYLYKRALTRENRFMSRDKLRQFLDGNEDGVFTVDGCQITNTTSYIDLSITDNTISFLLLCSYLKVNSKDYTYLGFIDRIEPNNFDSLNRNHTFYRIYFTVDWWSTLQYNLPLKGFDDDVVQGIEGDVERAHVNDIEKDNNTFHKTVINTTRTAETTVDRMKNSNTLYPFGENAKRFLWCLSAKTDNSLIENSKVANIRIGGRGIPLQYKLVIIPLFRCQITYRNSTQLEVTREIGSYNPSPSIIDDSAIIWQYVSEYCPFYNKETNKIIINTPTPAQGLDTEDYVTIETYSAMYDTNVEGFFVPNYFSSFVSPVDISSDFIKTFKNLVVSIPNTYTEYLDTIAKIDFYPYTTTFISCDGEICEINTEYINNDNICEYNISPDLGGAVVRFNYNRHNQLDCDYNYRIISSNKSFPPQSVNDTFTALTRLGVLMNMTASASSGAIGTANKYAVEHDKGVMAIPSISGALGDIATGARDIGKSLLLGENGIKAGSNNTASYFSPTMILEYSPVDRDRVLKDLALYGYNTYLHPHDILENHQRKYFNYIKLNNCELKSLGCSTEIRLQIEEMFNNGVWLWNSAEEFGNFEVPNYPLIMEA